MATRQCQCINPRACTCFPPNTPLLPRYYPPGPQSPQYPQAYSSYNDPMQPYSDPRLFSFQNTYQTSYGYVPPSPASTSPAFRVALGDTTNTTGTAPTQRQKRKRNSTNSSANTRRRLNNASQPDAPAVFGVGPSTVGAAAASAAADSVHHPAFTNIPGVNLGSILDKADRHSAAASDVWYFTRGVHSAARITCQPERDTLSTKRPDKTEFSHLACRLCSGDDWNTWKNVDGQTSNIRHHLKSAHGKVWRDMVLLKQLKGWDTMGTSNKNVPSGERAEFSLPGFYERLVKWIAVDDQSLDVVDCPELRDLLLFVGAQLEDDDIPHRTKLSQLIATRFHVEYNAMIHEIQNALGRVAMTDDIWTRVNLDSHLAITAHYIIRDTNGNLVFKTQLVAFRRLDGSHTGDNVGKVFVQVMKEIGCLHKISTITCDNAGNNGTQLEEIQFELNVLGIPFDSDGNRIRCFPHVINLAVKAGLKTLSDLPDFHPDTVLDLDGQPIPQALLDDPEYWDVLILDPVAAARKLVTACRASGQRRDNFEMTIEEGNNQGGWGDPPTILRVVGLLKDVETRWSATFLMIDRVLEQYQAIDKFLNSPGQEDIAHHSFDAKTLQVLQDIRRFLEIFHIVQEIVSAEKTPTLSIVLPMYEKLIVMLKNLSKDLEVISHAINASIRKLEEYLGLSRGTKIYSLAMILNPTIKLKWLRENWDDEDYLVARNSLRGSMLEYRKEMRSKTQSPAIAIPTTASRRSVQPPAASHSSRSQARGLARLNALSKSLSGSDFDTPSATTSSGEMSESEKAEAERLADIEDRRLVDEELEQYEAEGIIDEKHPEFKDFDLLLYWQRREFRFATLFRVALDVLPVQASAVPCERVFSSSKETDALRRGNLSPTVMEMLQIMKFIYRNGRITFTEGLVATEEELSVIDVEPGVLEELLATGKIQELVSLLNASWEGWGDSNVQS